VPPLPASWSDGFNETSCVALLKINSDADCSEYNCKQNDFHSRTSAAEEEAAMMNML
jgi:hypothetical protein